MLKYPNMRSELKSYLADLAAAARTPIAPTLTTGATDRQYYFELGFAISFLVDDLDVTERKDSLIGVLLLDAQEARQVVAVGASLIDYLAAERVGDQHAQASAWAQARALSQAALASLNYNDQ